MTFGSILTQTFTFPSWSPSTGLPSLVGKVALITGASSGLGKQMAVNLASKGAHVFCVGRSKEKTEAAIVEIISKSGNTKVEFLQADFMDLNSVEAAAETFLSKNLPLHILANNAGIMESPWSVSKQGIESQFATNHFAHVVLTSKLLPVLEKSQPSRIVVLSSISHYLNMSKQKGGIKYVTTWQEDNFDTYTRYGETKLATLHFARELQVRLDAKLGVNAVHPGVVRTELQRTMDPKAASKLEPILINSEKGALTQTYAAGSEDIEQKNLKGKYFVPYCKLAQPSADGQDKTQAVKTWEWTEKILKQQYNPNWAFCL